MKYAAIIKESIWIPGDERSRTAPGHGYPEHTEEVTRIQEFKDTAEMEAWVKRQGAYSSANYKLIQYEELVPELAVTVKVKKL